MNLTDSYMTNEMIFVVSGSGNLRSANDLTGKAVGVQSGTTSEELLGASPLSEGMAVTALDDNVALLYDMNKDGSLAEISNRWFGSDITSLK